MRILLATDAWEPQVNGVVRTLTRTVAECRAMGHEVEVVSPDQFKTLPLPTYPEIRLAMGAYEPMQERFKAFEPEAIHIATEGPVGLAARRLCIEWKLPFTTSYHTRFPEYLAARLPAPVSAGYAYMRWFHRASGRVMVATPTMREELTRRGFRNLSPWSRGVDTVLFHPDRAAQFPDVLAGAARPIFLNVGRVAPEKNIEAFLALDLPGTKVVVGDGPARDPLQARYPDAVFAGTRSGEELAAYFAHADALVFPSLTDTFGLVILEAMAAGAPVAAYPAPGPIDIIPGSGAGEVNEDLRQACLDCLKIDRRDVRRYAETFSWRQSAEEFVLNLQPYPEPAKTRFWRRLRRSRASAAAPPSAPPAAEGDLREPKGADREPTLTSPPPTARQIEAARAWLAERDPVLARAHALVPRFDWRARPGGFAGLIQLITEQQVSVASAAAIWARVAAGLGEVTAERVLAHDEAGLKAFGLSTPKARYALGIAAAHAGRTVDLEALAALDDEAAIAALVSLKGIGRWTAEVYLLFCEGRLDAFPAGDLALQEAVRALQGSELRPSEKALYARAEIWRPYRGVAVHLLWDYYLGCRAGTIPADVQGEKA